MESEIVGQAIDVDGLAVEGGQVDLEVAGVEDDAEGGGDGEGHRAGDTMAGLDELHLEAAQFHRVAGFHHVEVAGNVHLLELVLYEGHGQVRAVHGHVELLEGVGHGADMVLVAVGNDEAAQLLPVLLEIRHVRDHHVDARHVVVREREAAVDDDDVLPVLEEGHILSDLAHAPQGDELQFLFFLTHFSFLCMGVPMGEAVSNIILWPGKEGPSSPERCGEPAPTGTGSSAFCPGTAARRGP